MEKTFLGTKTFCPVSIAFFLQLPSAKSWFGLGNGSCSRKIPAKRRGTRPNNSAGVGRLRCCNFPTENRRRIISEHINIFSYHTVYRIQYVCYIALCSVSPFLFSLIVFLDGDTKMKNPWKFLNWEGSSQRLSWCGNACCCFWFGAFLQRKLHFLLAQTQYLLMLIG